MNEFDIHDVLTNIFELTIEWGRKEDITVQLNTTAKAGLLIADERRVKQILLNLIHNAITFTPEKGTITLDSTRDEPTYGFIQQIIITRRRAWLIARKKYYRTSWWLC